jgi:hypothetical protein
MTLYERKGEQFQRPAPSPLVLFWLGTIFLLFNSEVTALLMSAAEEFLARAAGATHRWYFYAPFAGRTERFFQNGAVGSLYSYSGLVLPGVAIAIAALITIFWPTTQKLSSRFFAQTLALALVVFGALPHAFDLTTRKGIVAASGGSEQHAMALAAIAGAVSVIAAMLIERRTIELMSNFYEVAMPGARATRWLLRIPFAFAGIGLLQYVNGFRSGAIATGVGLVATLLENLYRVPKTKFEKTTDPYMREAAAAYPFVLLPLLAAGIWFFGLRGAALQQRVFEVDDHGKITIESLQLARARAGIEAVEERGPAPTPAGEKKIDIRWSKRK